MEIVFPENWHENFGLFLLWHLNQFYRQISHATIVFIEYYKVREVLDALPNKLKRHPTLAIMVASFLFLGLLPVIFLTAFILMTFFWTFIGFIVIEGTLISIVAILFFTLIGLVILATTLIGGLIFFMRFGFIHISEIIDNNTQIRQRRLINE